LQATCEVFLVITTTDRNLFDQHTLNKFLEVDLLVVDECGWAQLQQLKKILSADGIVE
jgi:hypothetical protein